MKTLIAILLFFSLPLTGFTRAWQTYKLSKDVSVESPEASIDKKDGHEIYNSQMGSAMLMFYITPYTLQMKISNKKDLAYNYQEVEAGIFDEIQHRGLKPEKISSDSIMVGNITGHRTVIRFTNGQDQIIAEYRFFFLDGKMYQFMYNDLENDYNLYNADLIHYFESIKISGNPGFERQIMNGNSKNTRAYRAGYLTGYLMTMVAIILGITAVIVTAVILIVRRKKKVL